MTGDWCLLKKCGVPTSIVSKFLPHEPRPSPVPASLLFSLQNHHDQVRSLVCRVTQSLDDSYTFGSTEFYRLTVLSSRSCLLGEGRTWVVDVLPSLTNETVRRR